MIDITEISPAVRRVLIDNHFEPMYVLRYGPRFVCIEAKLGDAVGMFKMVLPEVERDAPDYTWLREDRTDVLERRLLKEAKFLQFFSQALGKHGFEPQIMALSEASPVWSFRTYIHGRAYSAWGSNFIFSQRFYNEVTPHQVFDFFMTLHRLSSELPKPLASAVDNFASILADESRFRFDDTLAAARAHPKFSGYVDQIAHSFERARPRYNDYERVITHYEPYAPHVYLVNGKICLIDWENVGWGHKLQDLSVFWFRMFDNPDWQRKFARLIEKAGYFEANGQLYWDSELLIQAFALLTYVEEYDPIGKPDYDARLIAFLNATIEEVLTRSRYFAAKA